MAANIAGMALIPYYNHIINLVETDPALKETARDLQRIIAINPYLCGFSRRYGESSSLGIFKQMGYAAGGAAIGGVLGGPLGALIGTTLGGVYGYTQSTSYDSLIIVLRDMDEERKLRLIQRVQELVGSSSIEALTSFIASQVNREMFLRLIQSVVSESPK